MKAAYGNEEGFLIAGATPSAETLRAIINNDAASSSAFVGMLPRNKGSLFTSSAHLSGNEAGGGSILLKSVGQGASEKSVGFSTDVWSRVQMEVWVQIVAKESNKPLIRKFLQRSESSAQFARDEFLELARQHANGVAEHPDMKEYFGTEYSLHEPAATGLSGGTAEFEFTVASRAHEMVSKLTADLRGRKTAADSPAAPAALMIFEEDCMNSGVRYDKIVLSYRQGQQGRGLAIMLTPCSGVTEWARKLMLSVRNADALFLASALYCGHTHHGSNQYFSAMPHHQGVPEGASCLLVARTTSKRVQADDRGEGQAGKKLKVSFCRLG